LAIHLVGAGIELVEWWVVGNVFTTCHFTTHHHQEIVMAAAIVDDRIEGTRITVWDIVHYLENNRSPERIAEILHLSLEQVQAAVQYIEEHKAEVMEVHREIEARIARGNPPEVEAKLQGTRARMQAWLKARREAKRQEDNGAGNCGRH
jgi:uncharacterized protein (DUF433 family)